MNFESPNPVLDKKIRTMSSSELALELMRYIEIKEQRLYDKIVNQKSVFYSIKIIKQRLKTMRDQYEL